MPQKGEHHGLAPRPVIASLYDVEARKGRGPGIVFEAVVGTREDQVAVAPGALQKSWTENGRRYFHYATNAPIGGEWGFFSANYAIQEAEWVDTSRRGQEVKIQIYHHPEHTLHLERMLKGIRASFRYYTTHFGPYPYDFISVVERPGNGTGMHADASMLSYTEGFTLGNPQPAALDHPFAVVAHEMAHQWTVPYANVEGAPVMSESIAWYYAMKVVEDAKGQGELRKFLHWMRQPYRQEIRRGEPLLRGLDPYMSYRRGPLALYALSKYLGEGRVNTALRNLVEKHEPEGAPLATTLDLFGELQAVAPDSLQYLLHDLFEVNTYWKLAMEQASAKPTAEGNWEVTLDIQAHKVVVDSAGAERQVPINDWIEIGVFQQGEQYSEPLYLQKHFIGSAEQKIRLTVPAKPASAGIDPYQLLVDEETNDNRKEVKL